MLCCERSTFDEFREDGSCVASVVGLVVVVVGRVGRLNLLLANLLSVESQFKRGVGWCGEHVCVRVGRRERRRSSTVHQNAQDVGESMVSIDL